MEIREVRDDLAESDGIGLVTWPASRVLLKWLQSSDEAPAVQGATVLDYVLSILFFFGSRCLNKRSEKTEIARPKKGNDEEGDF